jgi:hypothetical protein
MRSVCYILLAGLCLYAGLPRAFGQDIARRPKGEQTRWSSFENPAAGRGIGGGENRGAKGHPAEPIEPGEMKTLLDIKGSGSVRRIWLTVGERDPQMLRSLRLEMFWDGAKRPAVSVPLGDFFGAILGLTVPFENEFFASPEGHSFVTTIPMPFRTGARITVTNDSNRTLGLLFYDVNVVTTGRPDPDLLYFHATWRRERPTTLERDFEILPRVQGVGRFLGAHIGVIANANNPGWWGEGEVKMYLDGDKDLATLVGTGTEDYIGTGWGQGTYHNRLQGSLVADKERRYYTFYRYHVPDPVYFYKDLRVTIQQIGGAPYDEFAEMQKNANPKLKPITIDLNARLVKLLEPGAPKLESFPVSGGGWVNYFRQDDYSAVAFFYLDKPENQLPTIAPVAERIAELSGPRQH